MKILAIITTYLAILAFVVYRGVTRKPKEKKSNHIVHSTSNLLFGLPTICDLYPPLSESSDVSSDGIVLHEDDWRQMEFVPAQNLSHLEDSFDSQRKFRIQYRKGGGYTATYLRQEHPYPLSNLELNLDDLKKLVNIREWRGLYINWLGGPKKVEGGFAIDISEKVYIYCYAINNSIQQMGILVRGIEQNEGEGIVSSISALADLFLVSWYDLTMVKISEKDEMNEWWHAHINSG